MPRGASLQVTQWASYQMRKIAGCACAGNVGNVFTRHRLQRKSLVSDPGLHHGTCVTHVPWCMSGSLTRGGGENVPGIPAILCVWQDAHAQYVVDISKICLTKSRLHVLKSRLSEPNTIDKHKTTTDMTAEITLNHKSFPKWNSHHHAQYLRC